MKIFSFHVVSGGQTGADRAALDWAIANGISHGGWCPKGRRAEDGIVPDRYQLIETPSRSYLQRTEWNVRDSDATVIFTLDGKLDGGSKRTVEFAEKQRRPYLHLWCDSAPASLISFVTRYPIDVLNIAGKRESGAPGIGEFVKQFLSAAFFTEEMHSSRDSDQ
ncbi:MAG TPA: putative molybdenum carrier protein [Noviherbaspirillum sp.]|nr:putative molybdenum carrier protein [Noviherbaspirillum sp.]